MSAKPFYITTPIYYTSGNWHIGHCYTTVICDSIARYKKMQGMDVFYLTGTDEHGEKNAQSAKNAGVSEMEYINNLVDDLKLVWKTLDIDYTKFIRTTDKEHKKVVQNLITRLYEKGDIYKGDYEGLYCLPCESYWTKTQAVDGKCPDCGREVRPQTEQAYFFRLSKYADRLRKLLTETDFLQPRSRVNEMVNNFIDAGLTDLAITRKTVSWGIQVPFDPEHTIYVWIDALLNYISALGITSEDEINFKKYWPADVQVIGKEIVRFHSIIWPAILMALDLPLPKKLFAHGWLLMGGGKMSKSKGNIAKPLELCSQFGSDAVRYYLLREIPFGSDGVYTGEAFIKRINSDLVNDLGNLLNRTCAMSEQYFGGKLERGEGNEQDTAFINSINTLKQRCDNLIDSLEINKVLEEIFLVIAAANKYIDTCAPWALFKRGETKRLNSVLYNVLEALRVATILLTPFITRAPQKIFAQLAIKGAATEYKNAVFGKVLSYQTKRGEPIFPRLDEEKELAIMLDKQESTQTKTNEQPKEPTTNEITIDDFAKVCLKTAKVVACERVPKADKLLKLEVMVGEQRRTVVSGIAKHYEPEQLIGKNVVLVANLKPVVLRGVESRGMILCASDEAGNLCIVSPEKEIENAEVR